jgi:mono/diheme cytochrome c family protein/plastocyanin
MTMRREWIALIVLLGLVSLAVLVVGIGWWGREETILLRASMPEAGGWRPVAIQAKAGQPVHLRLTSEDVTHSFAVGQMEMEAIDIEPGELTELTLTFEQPGTYTYYCTRWCGPNHWRMRGTIEVSGESAEAPTAVSAPLYIQLGLDIDAPHPAAVTPSGKPSAAGVGDLYEKLSPRYLSQEYYRSHNPAQVWQELRADSLITGLSDELVWGLVAGIWQANTSVEKLEAGQDLYAQNCAACHGETGAGDGPMADDVAQSMQQMEGHEAVTPADFTDSASMLGASPALLHGKIARGGMGTGMPYWGPIFTDEQIWELVDYLYTFSRIVE